jgi:hypothetical protein
MKKLILILISIASVQSQALTLKITGPCSEEPAYEAQVKANLSSSIGQISQEIFDAEKIWYVGSSSGFAAIDGSPTGSAAVEVVSENEMRAYGWCYSVNGKVANVMPDKLTPRSQEDVVEWFFGYATLKNNQWSSEPCAPAAKLKSNKFCK